jgi:hypothetical protein
MIPADLRPLVLGLLKKARANEVNWVPAADLGIGGDEEDVVVSLPDYSINIFRTEGVDGSGITMSILSAAGRRIAGAEAGEDEPDYTILHELLQSASRKIAGVDVAISKLNQILSQPGVVGLTKKTPPDIEDDDLPF